MYDIYIRYIKKKGDQLDENITKEKGITLIALVITIVIMLLLAAVAIQMAIGNNRTYNKINRGKKRTSESRII